VFNCLTHCNGVEISKIPLRVPPRRDIKKTASLLTSLTTD